MNFSEILKLNVNVTIFIKNLYLFFYFNQIAEVSFPEEDIFSIDEKVAG